MIKYIYTAHEADCQHKSKVSLGRLVPEVMAFA